jgi:antirestriction protein ArdC
MATTKTRRPARKATDSDAPKRDLYQEVTDQMIALLEGGTVPWRQTWTAGGLHLSLSTRKAYRGVNAFVLPMIAAANGWDSRWWGTYRQIQAMGGQVRRGEKATTVLFFKRLMVTKDTDGTPLEEPRVIPLLRSFAVFNACQADDLTVPEAPDTTSSVVPVGEDFEPIEVCQLILDGYLGSERGPSFAHFGSQPCYTPVTDTVVMPHRETFGSPEQYYVAAFHEATHSTGHKDRLARKSFEDGANHAFGSAGYAKEELVAEMGSAFLAAVSGIAQPTQDNSAAYLANWLQALKDDKKLVVVAAAQAQKAADLIAPPVEVEAEGVGDEEKPAEVGELVAA